jgi:hypothetical protein
MLTFKVSPSAVLLGAALAFVTADAKAEVYSFDFTAFDSQLTAVGTFTVTGNEVTAISGALSGVVTQTISGLVTNASFPGASYSPDGRFIYDNFFLPGDPHFNANGVLFTTVQNPGGYWNLWGNGPGNYSLFESHAGGYPIQETGGVAIAAVPEVSTWAMTILGFAGLAFARFRRMAKRGAALAGA